MDYTVDYTVDYAVENAVDYTLDYTLDYAAEMRWTNNTVDFTVGVANRANKRYLHFLVGSFFTKPNLMVSHERLKCI